MSCSTLNQQAVRMATSMGALPEGYCPANFQELADAIAARLIVTPNQTFTSFAAGSVPPTSNVGPWFKDCETWYIWDDATASYVPMRKGGFDAMQAFLTSGTFTVPDGIYKVKVEAWGGGGGGAAADTPGGGGGGYGFIIRDVVPFQVVTITVGTGGAVAANGNDTVVLAMTAGGGKAGVTDGGFGGTVTGADYSINGASGDRANGTGAGNGGDSPKGGAGGTFNPTVNPPRNGVVPGGGGSGFNGGFNGTGAAGSVIVWY